MGYFASKYGNQSVAPNQSIAPIQSMLPKKPLPVAPKKQSILQNILTAIANAPKKNIKKTGEVVKKNIKQAGKAVMGVSKVGEGILQFGKGALIEAPARAAASVALSAPDRNKLSSANDIKRQEIFEPKSPLEQLFFGKKPVESISKQIKEAPARAEAFGIPQKYGKIIGPSAVIGLAVGDLLPMAKITKTAKVVKPSIVKSIIEQGAKQTERIAPQAAKAMRSIDISKQAFSSLDDVVKTIKTAIGKQGDDVIGAATRYADNYAQMLKDPALAKKASEQLFDIPIPPSGGIKTPSVPPTEVFNSKQYIKEMASKQQGAKGGIIKGLIGKGKDLLTDIRTKLGESLTPVIDVIEQAKKIGKFEILPTKDFYEQTGRVLRAPTIAGQFAKTHGLDEVIKKAPDLNALNQYLIAKQASQVSKKGIQTGRSLEKDTALIKELGPVYEPYAQKVAQYSQKLLDYITDSGLISKDLAGKLKLEYPDYVPLNRIFTELEQQGQYAGGKAIASLSKQNVVQKLKGSAREIEDPLNSLLSKTYDAFKQGEKNIAGRLFAGYKDLPILKDVIKEVPKGQSAKHTFSFLDNGVKRTFETTPEIETALKQLDTQRLNILGKIFAFPVRVARLGITGLNLPFIAANVARDQVGAFINSSKGLRSSAVNVPVFLQALWESLGHGKLYQEAVSKGALGTSFDIAREQIPRTIKQIRASRSIPSQIAYTATHPKQLLRAVENVIARSEELARMQQYLGTKQALLKQGRTTADTAVLATKQAREASVDFMRRGEWGTVLNSAFLYLNAGIQGSRTILRTFKQRPIATSAKIVASVYLPVAMTTAWNLGDPKRKEAYDDIQQYEKDNNLIIIPPNPTKDESGKWNVIKIPLPFNYSALVKPIRETMDGLANKEYPTFQKAVQYLWQTPIETLSPFSTVDFKQPEKMAGQVIPQAVKPTIEALTNKNLFTGLPIVPQSMQERSPELQVKSFTSGTARIIGKTINASPLKVENFIKGTAGGVGLQALHYTDKALAETKIIPKEQIGGQGIFEAITARFQKAVGGKIDDKIEDNLKDLLQKQADDRFLLKQEAEMVYQELKDLNKSGQKEIANQKYKELKTKNPLLAEKIKDVKSDEELGLTYSERLMKQLGVENGERAKFIWETLNAFQTNEEKNAYVKDLKKKKIISDEVFKQLKKIKQD